MIEYFWVVVVVTGFVLEGLGFHKTRPSLPVLLGLISLISSPLFGGTEGILLLLLGESLLFLDIFQLNPALLKSFYIIKDILFQNGHSLEISLDNICIFNNGDKCIAFENEKYYRH